MTKSANLHFRRVEIRLATDKILNWLKKFEDDEILKYVIFRLIHEREIEIERGQK